MSYLNPLRLHFAGRFQASVSTVNNDPVHYDNQQFSPDYLKRQSPTAMNGWWNPGGDATWRLIGCAVTSAWLADGQPAPPDDRISDALVADSDHRVAAKLVDLDSEQQLVSEIWGLEVGICDTAGHTLLRGQFEPAVFIDIWTRWPTGQGDGSAAAMYQSVLIGLEWGDLSGSTFLQQLKATAPGMLSIKFNVDSYDTGFKSPNFTTGRIVGTIGPAAADEPRHLVQGRQFMTTGLPVPGFFTPAGQLNFCVAAVDSDRRKILLDLGNALPIEDLNGLCADIGSLSVVCQVVPEPDAGQFPEQMPLGLVSNGAYRNPLWYPTTAGVVELPPDRPLTDRELTAIASNPLAILRADPNGNPLVAIAETPSGVFARADRFVFRMSPGDHADVDVYATQFGQPYPGARILTLLDPNQLQPSSAIGTAPAVATPIEAVAFPARIVTDATGRAGLPIDSTDPGTPRAYIDGQVYGIRPVLEETLPPGINYPFNALNLVSVLVWSGWHPDEPPTWYGSMQPIFQQYANLYPVMQRIVNLADYEAVCANRELLLQAFKLEVSNPNSMPVTRDLSPAKRQSIVRWLSDGPDGKELGPEEKPLLGILPPTAAAAPAGPAGPVLAMAPPPNIGGKLSAMSRRLVLRRPKGRG